MATQLPPAPQSTLPPQRPVRRRPVLVLAEDIACSMATPRRELQIVGRQPIATINRERR